MSRKTRPRIEFERLPSHNEAVQPLQPNHGKLPPLIGTIELDGKWTEPSNLLNAITDTLSPKIPTADLATSLYELHQGMVDEVIGGRTSSKETNHKKWNTRSLTWTFLLGNGSVNQRHRIVVKPRMVQRPKFF